MPWGMAVRLTRLSVQGAYRVDAAHAEQFE
jgi:hypothetical protein